MRILSATHSLHTKPCTAPRSAVLATGESLQAVVPNEDAAGWSQGTPVHVHLPADALRVLAGGAEPAPADADAVVAS